MADIVSIAQDQLAALQEIAGLLRGLLDKSEEQKQAVERATVEASVSRQSERDSAGSSVKAEKGPAAKNLSQAFGRNAAGVADLTDPFLTYSQLIGASASRTANEFGGPEAARAAANTTGFASAERVFGSAEDQTRAYFSKLAAAGVPVSNQQIQSFQADAERRSRNVENVNQQITGAIGGTQANQELLKAAIALQAVAAAFKTAELSRRAAAKRAGVE